MDISIMVMILIIILALIIGALNMACFFIGAKIGQTAYKGERIELPAIDPMKPAREREARKEAEIEQNRVDVILRNIEAYDGTGRGQEDVPGR